jgi:transcription elongation factor Elf1
VKLSTSKKIEQMRNQLEKYFQCERCHKHAYQKNQEYANQTCEKHTQISITKLRDRKQVASQPIHKSDIIQGEATIYLDDTSTEHLTLLVIPKNHILLVIQGSEDGELFLVSGHVS